MHKSATTPHISRPKAQTCRTIKRKPVPSLLQCETASLLAPTLESHAADVPPPPVSKDSTTRRPSVSSIDSEATLCGVDTVGDLKLSEKDVPRHSIYSLGSVGQLWTQAVEFLPVFNDATDDILQPYDGKKQSIDSASTAYVSSVTAPPARPRPRRVNAHDPTWRHGIYGEPKSATETPRKEKRYAREWSGI